MACNAEGTFGNEFGWCEGREVVHQDGDREYCVFHAPADKKFHPDTGKPLSVEEFNSLIFAEIDFAKNESRKCDLSGTVFPGDILFKKYGKDNSLPEIYFSGAKFGGAAYFIRAKFGDKAYFGWAKFDSGAYFGGAEFGGEAYFTGAKFFGEADFEAATFGSETSFYRAEFDGEAYFFRAKFDGAAEFSTTEFKKVAILKHLKLEKQLRFRDMKLLAPAFMGTDLMKCEFIACDWQERDGRYVLYDEEEYRDDWNMYRFKTEDARVERVRAVEDLYRTMKRKARAGHDEFAFAHWHMSEKEMQLERTTLRTPFNWAVLNAYKQLSGFGEEPKRALLALLVMAYALSLLIGWAGIKEMATGEPVVAGVSYFRDIFLCTLQYSIFEKDPAFAPAGMGGQLLKFLTKLLVPLQTALFAFALRNRFRR